MHRGAWFALSAEDLPENCVSPFAAAFAVISPEGGVRHVFLAHNEDEPVVKVGYLDEAIYRSHFEFR